MAEQRHITRQEVTWANFLADGDHGQSGILTDVLADLPYDEWVWKNDDATKTYVAAAQKYWTGAAWVYCDADFNDVTAQGDLYTSEYVYHLGDTDTNVRFQVDQITLTAGNVPLLDLVEGAADYVNVPNGQLFVHRGDSLGTAAVDADEFVIEYAGDGGMSVIVTDGNVARFAMGDASNTDFFELQADETNKNVIWEHQGTEVMRSNTVGGTYAIQFIDDKWIYWGNTATPDVTMRFDSANQEMDWNIGPTATLTPLHWTFQTASTAVADDVLLVGVHSSGDAAEGFGPSIVFQFGDTGVADNILAKIQAIVGNADTEGDLAFLCGTNGVEEFARIHQTGKFSVGVPATETAYLNVTSLSGADVAFFAAAAGVDLDIHLKADSETWFLSNVETSSNILQFLASTGKANHWFTTDAHFLLGHDDITWDADQETAFSIVDANYGQFGPGDTTNGALVIRGYTKAAAESAFGLALFGYTDNDPTDEGCVHVRTFKRDGSDGLEVLGGAAHVFAVENYTTQILTLHGDGALELNGPLYLLERAAARASAATWGQLWIRDTTPNEFWWTDDAGTDHKISPGLEFSQTASKTVANTVVETTLTAAGVGSLTLPADFLVVGRTIRVMAWGVFSTKAAPASTLDIKLKLGGNVIGSTGAINMGTAETNIYWQVESVITCRTTGAGGSLFQQGGLRHNENAPAEEFHNHAMSNVATDAVDTTGALAVDVTAEWGDANAANTITCTNLYIEAKN